MSRGFVVACDRTMLSVKSWNGTPISRRTTDGYVNATAMAKASGKQWYDYFNTNRASTYLEALSRNLEIPVTSLYISKPGEGTWIHPRLAVDFARWISAEFAVWMDGWFMEEMTRPVEQRTYFRRFSVFPKKNLMRKHWCVFLQITELLEVTHERMRLDVAQRDLIDGSVGKMWAKHREGQDWAVERHKMEYTFPDETKPVEIWQYHNSELPYFKEWLDEVYEPEHLYSYTKRKFGEMPAVAMSHHYECSEERLVEFTSKRRTQKQMDRLMDQLAKFRSNNPRAQLLLPFENGNWLSRVY